MQCSKHIYRKDSIFRNFINDSYASCLMTFMHERAHHGTKYYRRVHTKSMTCYIFGPKWRDRS